MRGHKYIDIFEKLLSKSTDTGKLSSKTNTYRKATKMEALSTEEIDLISSSWDLVAADEAGNGQQFFA